MRHGEAMICSRCEADLVLATYDPVAADRVPLCASCDARLDDFREVLRLHRSDPPRRLFLSARRRILRSLARERRSRRKPSWAAVLVAGALFALLWYQGPSPSRAWASSWMAGPEIDRKIEDLHARVVNLGVADTEPFPSILDEELADLRRRLDDLELEDESL